MQPVKSAHPCAEIRLIGLDEEVMVVRKQAAREHVPGERDRRLREERQEPTVSGVVGVRVDARKRVTGHVMDQAGTLYSWSAQHAESLACVRASR
jgi:hypothetical protein